MSRADEMFGKKDPKALGGDGPLVLTPWRSANGRVDRRAYDESLVHDAIRKGQPTEKVDPRNLVAMQPHLRRDIVRHYVSNPDQVHSDHHDPGNKRPIVYDRNGQHLIISGHHRAAAALLRGEQFDAVVVHGGFGEEYKR